MKVSPYIHRRWFTTALVFFCVVYLTGCASVTQMSTRYKPLHPANNASVEFAVKATDGDGIKQVNLYVYEYALSVVNGMQTATKRTGGLWGNVRTWNYTGGPKSIDEKYSVSGFPSSTFITFIFEVIDDKNKKKQEEWSFAAGTWPFGNNPIPVWGNGAPAERIDVCFIADRTDYTNARNMLPDLEPLIFDGYHINNGVKRGKKYWQFYYSPERGFISDFDDGTFQMDIPNSVQNSSIIDHGAIIHTTVKRDWASGGNFGTEPTNIGTAVHESGHAAFKLKDEYSGGGHGTSGDPHHNNYNSQTSCQNYNTSNGWAASDCQNIEGSWWRPEPSSLKCIMLDDGDAAMPDFARTCINRIVWFYSQLETP
jgi:hypothetical protein